MQERTLICHFDSALCSCNLSVALGLCVLADKFYGKFERWFHSNYGINKLLIVKTKVLEAIPKASDQAEVLCTPLTVCNRGLNFQILQETTIHVPFFACLSSSANLRKFVVWFC